MLGRCFFVLNVALAFVASSASFAQDGTGSLFRDYVVVQKESAEAKRVRLEWISEERDRIRKELTKFADELAKIDEITPRRVQDRTLSTAQNRERDRERTSFENWKANNDPTLRPAIVRGQALNALLRVLGPIAHYRKARTNDAPAANLFPALLPQNAISAAEMPHYRMNIANSSGPKVEMRINQLPLQIEWPSVLIQKWKPDCANLNKARDEFVVSLCRVGDDSIRIDRAELLDKSLSLLQAKIQKEKREVVHEYSLDGSKRVQIHRDLQSSFRYLESVRATVDRLKNVPSDYRVQRFLGGSIEDFLDFCFMQDMIFLEARPHDDEFYTRMYRRMQDYASDVQYIEDWRKSIDQRIAELNDDDKKLVWQAAEQ